MKSLEAFYQSDLLPDLEKLEAKRLTVKRKLRQAIIIFVVVNLIFLFIAGKFGINFIFILIFLVISAIFSFFPWHLKYYREYQAGFKDKIIPKIIAFIDQRLRYTKDGMVPREEFMNSHLFNDKPGDYIGDDLVSGTLGETAIQFSEIHAKRVDIVRRGSSSSHGNRRSRKKYTPIFRGLFFVADFNKSFKGTTLVLPDTVQKLFGDIGQALQRLNVTNGQLIKMEDPEFEKLFVVYGQDQVEARYVLSTSLMRRIVDFQSRMQKKMRFSFSTSKLYVAIEFERELFEPSIKESLLTLSLVQEYYDDLKLVKDLVEELNLNTRIWTQKTPSSTNTVAKANAAIEINSVPDLSIGESPPPPELPAQKGTCRRYTEKETQALFKEFVNKADTSLTPKINMAKKWLMRIAGVFLFLLSLPFILTGTYMAGLIVLGFGLFFLSGGFLSPTMSKAAAAVIFPAIGIVIALLSYSSYKTSLETNTWPTIDGTIVRSEIERQTSTSDKGAEETLYPKIAYQYRIDGQEYKSAKISFSSLKADAKQLVSQYPVSKTVQVYYNPQKPKQAVLVPGGNEFNMVPYIFSAVFIFLGLAFFSQWRRQTRVLGRVS